MMFWRHFPPLSPPSFCSPLHYLPSLAVSCSLFPLAPPVAVSPLVCLDFSTLQCSCLLLFSPFAVLVSFSLVLFLFLMLSCSRLSFFLCFAFLLVLYLHFVTCSLPDSPSLLFFPFSLLLSLSLLIPPDAPLCFDKMLHKSKPYDWIKILWLCCLDDDQSYVQSYQECFFCGTLSVLLWLLVM